MQIYKIIIPSAPLINYSNDSLINGYYWLDYLTDEDREYYSYHYIDNNDLKSQIKSLLRIKQIEDILI